MDEDGGVLDASFTPEDPDAVTKNKLGTINGVCVIAVPPL